MLVPLRAEDADELADLLRDERLHEFIGGAPASRLELYDRFVLLSAGSPRPGEDWYNWVVRRRLDSQAVGTVQATIRTVGDRRSAHLGWMIGVEWQNRGIASEAAVALVGWVRRQGVDQVVAHIHPEHGASEAVATRAGLVQTEDEVDGERVWRA
ncbi:MAG TPA: GNAT family N-acetyltransferase [Gaiellaceae bacterium]|nr:GNAT family N-acetyltransferase [Gaiellaceae bacterium]